MVKDRLDVILVKRGLYESREKAKRAVMSGNIFVDNCREDKPGKRIPEKSTIEIKGDGNPYVSRGGLKLEKGLKDFNIDLKGKKVIDIGASTGGFTDCMLKYGADTVIAVDVGYGQFDWKLRNNKRVVCMERTNARYLKPEDIPYKTDFCTIDVSFISLKKIIPAVINLLKTNGEIVCLIKPQFEAGRDKVGRHGVVLSEETHKEVVMGICQFAVESSLKIRGITFSPIKGPKGNIEYILYISKEEGIMDIQLITKLTEKVIYQSHKTLI